MKKQIHRCVWLTAALMKNGEVAYTAYHGKFKLSERSYQRDLAIVAQSGVQHASKRNDGRVVLTGFLP